MKANIISQILGSNNFMRIEFSRNKPDISLIRLLKGTQLLGNVVLFVKRSEGGVCSSSQFPKPGGKKREDLDNPRAIFHDSNACNLRSGQHEVNAIIYDALANGRIGMGESDGFISLLDFFAADGLMLVI